MTEIDKLQAELADCHANINIKADFIDATINQLAAADELADTLRAEVASLEAYIMQMEDNLYKLQAEVARLRDVLEDIAQFKFYDGFPTPESGRASAALEQEETT
jgi:chromosome segregation ATPase